MVKKYSYICSNHFHPKSIIHLPGRTRIKKNVIPFLFLGNEQNVVLDTSPQSARDVRTDEGGMVKRSFSSSSTTTAPEMLKSDDTENSEFSKNRLEESFSTSTASEAVLEMEKNDQPEEKFEDSFSTSTASEALMEMKYIEQNQLQRKVNSSSTTEDDLSSAKNESLNKKRLLKMIPAINEPKSGLSPAANKFVPLSSSFQDIFQRKVRQEILSDIAMKRMHLQRKSVTNKKPLQKAAIRNGIQPQFEKISQGKKTKGSFVHHQNPISPTRSFLKRKVLPHTRSMSEKKSDSQLKEVKPLPTQPSQIFLSPTHNLVNDLPKTIQSLEKSSVASMPSQGTHQTHFNPLKPLQQTQTVHNGIQIQHHFVEKLAEPDQSLRTEFISKVKSPEATSMHHQHTPLASTRPLLISQLSNITNDTKTTAQCFDSTKERKLSNSSTDTASETSYYINKKKNVSRSITEENKKRCRTCLNSIYHQSERAYISMICFEGKSVKEGLVQLLPQMNSTLADDHFVCDSCFSLLRNALKFMKKCQETEKVIAVESEANLKSLDLPDGSNDEFSDGSNDDDDDDDSTFQYDPNLDEEDYVSNAITNIIKAKEEYKPYRFKKRSHLYNNIIKHLNLPPLKYTEVRDHNCIVSISDLQPEFIHSLQKKRIKLLHSCSKFDENVLKNKRVLLLGDQTEIQCLLCEERFSSDEKMQDHILNIHGLSKAYLMEPYCYQYMPGSSNKCEACGKEFRNGELKKTHLKKCFVFPCPYCDKMFTTSELSNHTKEEHDDPQPFKCLHCKLVYGNFINFKRHLCNDIICETCGKNFRNIRNFALHKNECNYKEVTKRCTECYESFSLSSFQAHFATHKFPCSFCGKIFRNRKVRYRHEYNHRMNQGGLCPLCGRFYTFLPQHMRTHENKQSRTVKCSLCPKLFMNKADLNRHMKLLHMTTRIICERCLKICSEYNIESHYESEHPNETEFKCAKCDCSFTRITFLKQHAKSHAYEVREELDRKKQYMKSKGGPRRNRSNLLKKNNLKIKAPNTPITCKYCLKTVKGVFHYRRHLETHIDLYRYKCKYCEMTYSTHGNKLRHEKLHNNKPHYKFRCGECWKVAKSQEELDAHMEHHASKPKKYQCEECSEQFCREYQFRSHQVNMHSHKDEVEKVRDEIIIDALKDFAV
ncbi:uncharacterized protein isoform X3 [Leptinotarsa decemlineata]